MKYILSIILLVLSFSTLAKNSMPCKEISWIPNQVYYVNSQLHTSTHIILPEPMQGNPVNGNPSLWAVAGENIHLFIKPKNYGNAEGKSTTVTVVSESNNSYDFIVNRVQKKPDVCIKITQENYVNNEPQKNIGQNGWLTTQEKKINHLSSNISDMALMLQKQKSDSKQKTLDALAQYRSNIYTGYTWSKGRSFSNKNVVSDVWDDGRFTYIRLRLDNKGIFSLHGYITDKPEMIEADYDSDTKIYTVAGLYRKFDLVYDKNKVTIKRANDITSGGY